MVWRHADPVQALVRAQRRSIRREVMHCETAHIRDMSMMHFAQVVYGSYANTHKPAIRSAVAEWGVRGCGDGECCPARVCHRHVTPVTHGFLESPLPPLKMLQLPVQTRSASISAGPVQGPRVRVLMVLWFINGTGSAIWFQQLARKQGTSGTGRYGTMTIWYSWYNHRW